MACPLSVLHTCGKEITQRATSGAVYKVFAPDERCKIRVEICDKRRCQIRHNIEEQ